MRTPRPHQTKALADLRAAYNAGFERILYQLPTGGGKTDIMAMMCAEAMQDPDQIVRIDVHRDTLIQQFSERLNLFGLDFGVVAGDYPEAPHKRIQLVSVFSMAKRLDRYPKPDIVLNDECHNRAANIWEKCAIPSAVTIGFSATPCRLDGKGLRDYYDVLICGPQPKELIRDGYLVRPIIHIPTRVDASACRVTKAGDWNSDDAAQVVTAKGITGKAIESYKEFCDGLPAVAFCCNVKHAEQTAAEFNAAGIPAASIDGKQSKYHIRAVLENLKNGSLKVVTSCELISEGFDLPLVTVCIMLRPTKSLRLFLQAVGRVLRAAENKPFAYLLDHVGNVLNPEFGIPHRDRTWTLDGRPKVERGEREAIPRIVQCESCYSWVEPAPLCDVCGAEMKRAMREIKEIEGRLMRLEEEAAAEILSKAQKEKARNEIHQYAYKMFSKTNPLTLPSFISYCAQRGYGADYAAVIWRACLKKNAARVARQQANRRAG
ncbi:MAG: DEAD/DEAH box helicase [Candidatus Melainabacteria bacterium]|nr:MAG: DEAD/DEAH box helicase [Candidatus Melainabacteria bacterium]